MKQAQCDDRQEERMETKHLLVPCEASYPTCSEHLRIVRICKSIGSKGEGEALPWPYSS